MQSHRLSLSLSASEPPSSPPPPPGRDGCRISMTKRRWDAFSSLLLIHRGAAASQFKCDGRMLC